MAGLENPPHPGRNTRTDSSHPYRTSHETQTPETCSQKDLQKHPDQAKAQTAFHPQGLQVPVVPEPSHKQPAHNGTAERATMPCLDYPSRSFSSASQEPGVSASPETGIESQSRTF